jgi:Txe/YoeB family toxin of Txe-Axe toxin-antitoxin module
MKKGKPEVLYFIILPSTGRGQKEIQLLLKRRKKQLEKTINKLKKYPTDFTIKGIEKLTDNRLGQYTIRVSKGDRLFYDVDDDKKVVSILRAGKHDLYKLL